jgi:hypothetical protein
LKNASVYATIVYMNLNLAKSTAAPGLGAAVVYFMGGGRNLQSQVTGNSSPINNQLTLPAHGCGALDQASSVSYSLRKPQL